MTNKELYEEIKKTTEHLAEMLKELSPEPHYLSICIFSHDEDCLEEDDLTANKPCYFSYRVDDVSTDETLTKFSESGCVFIDMDGKNLFRYYRKANLDE